MNSFILNVATSVLIAITPALKSMAQNSTAATPEQRSVKPGDEGVAVTRLALIGNAEIGGKTVEVKSASGFLDEGTPVVVVRVDEAQVTVKKK